MKHVQYLEEEEKKKWYSTNLVTGIDSSKKMFEHSTTTNHATTTTFHTFCGHDEPVNKATMNNHDDDVVVEYKCVCVCVYSSRGSI